MSANRKFVAVPEPATPIQYLTENGFSIIRRCDLNGSAPKGGLEHCFIVRDPDGYEQYITVNLTTHAEGEVILCSSGRVTFDSAFWICAAERRLAEYLWERNDYPPDASLIVDQLTPADIDLARRWENSE